MAEIVCTKFQIGSPLEGGEIRKLLWENPTPTTAVGAFDATLSESIDNFDYMEIEYCYGIQTIIKSVVRTPIFLDDGVSYTFPQSNAHLRGVLGAITSEGVVWSRRYYLKNSTTLAFTTGTRVGAQTEGTAPCIPYAVYGIKITTDGFTSSYAFVEPTSTEFPYVTGVNTWTLPKPRGRSVTTLMFTVFKNAERTGGDAYVFYWNKNIAGDVYVYVPGTSSTNSRATIAYPASSSHRLGFSETDTELTVSFYETGTPAGNADLIATFE